MYLIHQFYFSSDNCGMEYAFALEYNRMTNFSICGGRHREVGAYISHTNKMEIYVNTQQAAGGPGKPAMFLLKYQGWLLRGESNNMNVK